MATYKVLQDIEAEDKILGPLTLKQFIFAIITIGIGFLNFRIATTTGLSVVRWPFFIALLIPMLVFGFLAAPIGRDQPNDVWLLARIRFLIKPHTRIWNQDGLRQLVTITAPKHQDVALTNGLDQSEVRSRLTALANTLDSRGWAVKNVDVNLFTQPDYLASSSGSDRLVNTDSLPSAPQAIDIRAADDIMDERSNPTAQHLDKMMRDSENAHRQEILQKVKPQPANKGPQADYWFMNQAAGQPTVAPSGYSTFQHNSVVAPGSQDNAAAMPTDAEKALLDKIAANKKHEPKYVSNLRVIQPLGQAPAPAPKSSPATTVQTNDDDMMLPVVDQQQVNRPAPTNAPTKPTGSNSTSKPAILSLANNDDLDVATIARQANRLSDADGEVVISLH